VCCWLDHDEGGLPYIANLVDVEGVEDLGVPGGHSGAAVVVVAMLEG
jgi:hypothetical protein